VLALAAFVKGQGTPPLAQTGATSAATTAEHFDPVAATNAYLAKVPPDKRAQSDAYFEGGYWLILWDFLASSLVFILLLATGWSARMRDWAERVTRFTPIHTFVYWTEFLVVTSLLIFPLGGYRSYINEHKYDLSTQTFGPLLGDQLK